MNTEDQKQATPLSDEMLEDVAGGWDDGSGTYVYTTTCRNCGALVDPYNTVVEGNMVTNYYHCNNCKIEFKFTTPIR